MEGKSECDSDFARPRALATLTLCGRMQLGHSSVPSEWQSPEVTGEPVTVCLNHNSDYGRNLAAKCLTTWDMTVGVGL